MSPAYQARKFWNFTIRLCSELAVRIFSDREWEQLTQDWYARRHWQDPFYATDTLFNWEINALQYFPRPPGDILVFAAGKGREIRALQSMGYSVFGVEMDSECLKIIQETCDTDHMIGLTRASFVDITSSKVNLPEVAFQGIIIGWAALTYVPSKNILREFFGMISQRYPNVPVLLSRAPANPPELIRKFLKKCGLKDKPPSNRFCRSINPWYGPCGHLTIEPMEEIFQSFGYDIAYRSSSSEYPHWVLN